MNFVRPSSAFEEFDVKFRLSVLMLALVALTAITPSASATRDGAVVIVGDHIVGVQAGGAARAPEQGRILDGSGKFLMPGLWDFHVHVFSAPGEEDLALPPYVLNGMLEERAMISANALTGTDAIFANPFLFHGFTLHDEWQRYVEERASK
jgi:cytosine/adenosine deaminase-related metal-dependent hydrolase